MLMFDDSLDFIIEQATDVEAFLLSPQDIDPVSLTSNSILHPTLPVLHYQCTARGQIRFGPGQYDRRNLQPRARYFDNPPFDHRSMQMLAEYGLLLVTGAEFC
ncbi:hypothetical protein [Marinobacterium rhizophilum]|uniref:hypothetical protein n=1 Tax=Marinobacterium rhizophilum TaxID=420402 RepID=UPI00036D0D91|nr:hypothetical protein [Marinobacterium rhizophilum]